MIGFGAAVHARLLRLVRRLLDDRRRLRRARRDGPRPHRVRREPAAARPRATTSAARVAPSPRCPTARTSSPRRSRSAQLQGRGQGERLMRRVLSGPRRCSAPAPPRSSSPVARPRAKRSDTATYKIQFDNAFGLVEQGDFRIGGVTAGQTSAFEVVKVDERAVAEVEVAGHRAGLRRPAQGRELRDQAAVADRRVLRRLPAGHVR